ncbi:MAG: nucleoside deaminase [Pseudomonadota bacterium]
MSNLIDAYARFAMDIAFEMAEQAFENDEVPVGAAIIDPYGVLLAKAANQMRQKCDPTAHAEITAIRLACKKLNTFRLDGCLLAVTLEPCAMCAAAIAFAHIKTLLISSEDFKMGCVLNNICYFSTSANHHQPDIISDIDAPKSQYLLRRFFSLKRNR